MAPPARRQRDGAGAHAPLPLLSTAGTSRRVAGAAALAATAALLLIATPLGASPPARPTLAAIVDIGNSGAPGLALRQLDAGQPEAAGDPSGWFEWERARMALLARWRQYPRALARLDQAPSNLPPGAQRWLGTQRAWVQLAVGEAAAARDGLRRLLWQREDAEVSERRAWRELIVRAYLAEQRYTDALTAIRRYQQDYRDPQPGWQVLRVRVLLSAGQSEGVASLLDGVDSPESDALRGLAQLREGGASAGAVFEQARERAEAAAGSQDKARWWAVAARAATQMSSSARVALALDQGLRHAGALAGDDELFDLSPAELWAAYRRFGKLLGNNLQLLLGNDPVWLEEAEKSLPLTPIRARALLSVIAFEGAGAEARELAHARIAETLAREPGGYEVLRALYVDAGAFDDMAAVPLRVRYHLADFALTRSDIELATRIMATLDAAPQGADAFDWQLRRARVLVMGGRAAQGAKALEDALALDAAPQAQQLDRLLQVVFDLQAVGAHEQAAALLGRLLRLQMTPERHREIMFWQAESRKALGDYTAAAWGFMRSATLIDPRAGDPWGQTARYSAAEALTRAGLIDDAQRIYRALLSVTSDPERAAVLRQRLQQLWLGQAADDNVAPD